MQLNFLPPRSNKIFFIVIDASNILVLYVNHEGVFIDWQQSIFQGYTPPVDWFCSKLYVYCSLKGDASTLITYIKSSLGFYATGSTYKNALNLSPVFLSVVACANFIKRSLARLWGNNRATKMESIKLRSQPHCVEQPIIWPKMESISSIKSTLFKTREEQFQLF